MRKFVLIGYALAILLLGINSGLVLIYSRQHTPLYTTLSFNVYVSKTAIGGAQDSCVLINSAAEGDKVLPGLKNDTNIDFSNSSLIFVSSAPRTKVTINGVEQRVDGMLWVHYSVAPFSGADLSLPVISYGPDGVVRIAKTTAMISCVKD